MTSLLARFEAAAARYAGWSYGGYDPAAQTVDCCSYAAVLLDEVYSLDLAVGGPSWSRLCVWDGRDPWSAPLEVARLLPGAVHVDHLGRSAGEVGPQMPTAGRVHLAQGWTDLLPDGTVGPQSRGHVLLWVADSVHTGRTIESQQGEGPTSYEGAWSVRTARYTSGVAWCVLPDIAEVS